MAITFNCPCGEILAAKDGDVGKKAVCPGCGKKLLVPYPGNQPEEVSPLDQLPQWYEKVEEWMFSQQRRLWQIAGAALAGAVGIYVGFVVLGGGGAKIEVTPDPEPATSARDFGDFDAKLGSEPWVTDFESFSDTARETAKSNQRLDSVFANRTVRWTVTFTNMHDNMLYFQEAEPLLEDNLGIYVQARFLPRERTVIDRLKAGDRIVVRGTIANTMSGRNSAHPYGYIRIGPINCTIEPHSTNPASDPPAHDPTASSEGANSEGADSEGANSKGASPATESSANAGAADPSAAKLAPESTPAPKPANPASSTGR